GQSCLCLSLASLGCVGVFTVALVAFLVIASITSSVGNVLGSVGSFFNNAAHSLGGAPSTRIIVLPQVEALQQLSDLTTVRFDYARVVTAEQQMPALLAGLYGNRLVMMAVGHIEAGIDMSQVTEDSIQFYESEDIIRLTLPAPRLLRCYLNEQQTQIVERSSGFFAVDQPALDNESRRYALRQFRDLALQGIGNRGEVGRGILEEAQAQAEQVVSNFLKAFNASTDTPRVVIQVVGFFGIFGHTFNASIDMPRVVINFQQETTPAPYPDTCQ
ncbi:MAG: DUF4230 domain-containing protein, partial [Anaerolineae bacterium]|nr:DUF4230 domain-containing protein [Anaerolineae bacterium]